VVVTYSIDGHYYIMYTAVSRYGYRIALARTNDFESFERVGLVSRPGNKDGVLFPEKINGLYARLDRPIGNDVGNIWISYSPDLIHWGRSELVISPRPRFWDAYRIGASVPPVRTERDGEVKLYYGAADTSICAATCHIDELIESCFEHMSA
jgi:predicted GH43/DUF377 family glycosyl hydrolase